MTDVKVLAQITSVVADAGMSVVRNDEKIVALLKTVDCAQSDVRVAYMTARLAVTLFGGADKASKAQATSVFKTPDKARDEKAQRAIVAARKHWSDFLAKHGIKTVSNEGGASDAAKANREAKNAAKKAAKVLEEREVKHALKIAADVKAGVYTKGSVARQVKVPDAHALYALGQDYAKEFANVTKENAAIMSGDMRAIFASFIASMKALHAPEGKASPRVVAPRKATIEAAAAPTVAF